MGMLRPRGWATLAEQIAAGMRGNGAPIADEVINGVELDPTKRATTAIANKAILYVDGLEFGGLKGLGPLEAVNAVIKEIVLSYETVSSHFSSLEVSS